MNPISIVTDKVSQPARYITQASYCFSQFGPDHKEIKYHFQIYRIHTSQTDI